VNRLEEINGRYFANGMEVSEEVYTASLMQNFGLAKRRVDLLLGLFKRPWNKLRSAKASREPYAYRVPYSSLRLIETPIREPLYTQQYDCIVCCDVGKVNCCAGGIAPCPRVGCKAKEKYL
jgi:hypothetical protein